MGQYHLPVNLDKREFIYSHTLDNGLKLLEHGEQGVLGALQILLAASSGRGGGDYSVPPSIVKPVEYPPKAKSGSKRYQKWIDYLARCDARNDPIIGRWAGDRIVTIGDYGERDDYPVRDGDPSGLILYTLCFWDRETPLEDIGPYGDRRNNNERWAKENAEWVAEFVKCFGSRETEDIPVFTDISELVKPYVEHNYPDYRSQGRLCPDTVIVVGAAGG